MDISQILIDASNPNLQIRTNAENTLKKMEQTNLTQFLGLLMQELSNEQKPPNSRKLSGIIIKNAIYSKDEEKNEILSQGWLKLDMNFRNQFKNFALKTLGSPCREARQSSSQVVSAIGAIELPNQQWPELINYLVSNVTKSLDNNLRQSTLESIGYLCEELESGTLQQQANMILTAIVHGMRKEETSEEVRLSAVTAMLSTLDFISPNMKNENERNFIMKVICENTQHTNQDIRIRSFQCLSEIAYKYYSLLSFYIQQIFQITMNAITKDTEPVGMQGIEFWITICEIELELTDEKESGNLSEPLHNFIANALKPLVQVLLVALTKQDEDPESEETTLSTQAGILLEYMSTLVDNSIVQLVLPFVTKFINDMDWRKREAAIFAFGAILDGPERTTLSSLIKQAFPILLNHMKDKEQLVRDTTAYTLSKICQLHHNEAKLQLNNLMMVLVESLNQPPKVASKVCHSLNYLASGYEEEAINNTSPLSQYFQVIISKLLESAKRQDLDDDNLRVSIYEAINSFIRAVARDKLPLVLELLPLLINNLELTFQVSVDKRYDIQSPICLVLITICRKLGNEILNHSDRMMGVFLKLFSTPNSLIFEDAFNTIGAVATALGKNFERYLNHLMPYVFNSLQNISDYQVNFVAVNIITDLFSSVGNAMLPHCDQIMKLLLHNLKSEEMNRDVKPQILHVFGDIALAIQGNFEKYFPHVMEILFQAGLTKIEENSDYDFIDWITNLREGIMAAYSGIIQGLSDSQKSSIVVPHSQNILQHAILFWKHKEKSDELMSLIVGVVGDISQKVANLNPQVKLLLKHQEITILLDEASRCDFLSETVDWAKQTIEDL